MPQIENNYHPHFEYMFAFSKGSPKTFNPITEPAKYKGLANIKNRGQGGSLDYEKIENCSRNSYHFRIFTAHSVSFITHVPTYIPQF
jgi:hypothetical protein